MTFTQLDDTMLDGPEMLSVSRSARLLLLEGYQYGNRHLTDGAITEVQWRRATDTDDFQDELDQLADAGLVTRTATGWQLPWDKQQSRETVMKGRERRRQDNERRAAALNLHRAGDHSLCTHEGGGRHRNYGRSAGLPDGQSDGRSTGSSDGRSSGHAPGDVKDTKGRSRGRSTGSSNGRSSGHAPTQPSPAHPNRSETEGGGAGVSGPVGPALASAGAPAAAYPGRWSESFDFAVTADMLGGTDPDSLDAQALDDLIGERIDDGFLDWSGRVLKAS